MSPVVSPLAPVLAGARARGFADALQWLGVAAVLFDKNGEALYINEFARARLCDGLYVDAGRLRADDADLDAALQGLILRAVTAGEGGRVTIPQRGESAGTTVRVGAFDNAGDERFQLLKAVAILESATFAAN